MAEGAGPEGSDGFYEWGGMVRDVAEGDTASARMLGFMRHGGEVCSCTHQFTHY